ncbi:unnamed protein product [Phyllotreta striolata]|uniref:Estradiol 17-beta-dehydrogenase 2 n=1 Tax=Phyllotreta striolata TaxID=444603 RepID=A0A9N9TRK9_PHYSR|nr:unnamed protein product [Phyllotreta striolata]
MAQISKYLLFTFEILNEMYAALGTGAVGLMCLIKFGFQKSALLKTAAVCAATAASFIYIAPESKKIKPNKKKVVCITGCDSGLGFSLAQHSVDLGFTVIAGFLSLDSKGCKELRKSYGNNIIQIQLDITDSVSVNAALKTLQHFLGRNEGYTLHAIVNNAGVMVFGEFEWLTENLIQQQVNVNLLGTLKFTNAMCPLLRQYGGRIITITSHCSQVTLPSLAVYGATKAALAAFSDGLRVEMAKYGVNVITFIPGSFCLQSNIMARQLQNVQEMHDNFTQEQHSFYSDYFKRFNIYLSFITPPPMPVKIQDEKMYKIYEETLLDETPKVVYKNEDIRYLIYHTLFKISPWFVRDYLVVKFMSMPSYTPSKSLKTSLLEYAEDADL